MWKYWIHTKVPIVNCWGLKLSTRLHLVPRLRMSGAILILPLLYVFVLLTGKKFTFYLLTILNDSQIFTIFYMEMRTKILAMIFHFLTAVLISL
jgi:hypothetical protein